MRCLIVIPSLIRAGAETQAVDLANGLSAMGHQVHLCSFERQLDQRERLSGSVRFHHVLRKSKYDRSVITRLADIIDREQIEVVQGVLQLAALVAWLASRRSRCQPPVIAAVHTTINRGLKQELYDRLVYRRMLRRMAAVIFVCQNQKDHWVKKYPELGRAARVVYNGVDVSRFRKEEFTEAASAARKQWGIPDGAPVFSCLAAFRPEKGHDLLIKAFADVPDDCYLVLAGEGERRPSVEAAVDAAGLGGRVIFIGNVADVRPVIAASTATVLASTAVETFSIAMLESMAMGVPVIAPRIGGLPEAIVPGETGLLFKVGNYLELASCIRALAMNPVNIATMGDAARIRVIGEFMAKTMFETNETVLRQSIS